MLDQDTDRNPTQAQLDYWARRLPTSPGMRGISPRQKQRRFAEVLQQRAKRLKLLEEELKRRGDELAEREAATREADKVAPPVKAIVQLCSEGSGVSMGEILSPRRYKRIARVRQAAAWLAKQHSIKSLPAIGRAIGGRDHSTIIHAIRRTDERITAGDEDVLALISYVEARLG